MIDELIQILGKAQVLGEKEDLIPYSFDGTAMAVTYHDACLLCHGQKITSQPREIFRAIPGVALRECLEATMCCGCAGIYSLTRPRTSAWLLERKVGHIRSTGASVVATANPGCQLQIQRGLSPGGEANRVVHPVVLLAEAYRAGSWTILLPEKGPKGAAGHLSWW